MRITSVDVIALKENKASSMRPVVCKVNTDEGIYGYGEAGVAIVTGATAAYELMKDYSRMILGKNPLYNEVLWEDIFKNSFWGQGNGAVVMAALSALDTAIWDIRGKYYKAPLYELLGGRHRNKLRAYASQLQFGWGASEFQGSGDIEFYRNSCKAAVDQGYNAVKFNFFDRRRDGTDCTRLDTTGLLSKELLETVEERLNAVRDLAGKNVDIILENHAMSDAVSAVQICKIAEKYDILFLEEPATPLNPAVFRKIAGKTNIPLAAGERLYTRWAYLPYFNDGSLAVVQPDIGNCGGVTECKKICDMAHAYDVGVQTHVCSSPISVAVSLQLEAAIPNFVIHEHHVSNTMEHVTCLGLYNYQPKDGYFDIPDLPGIGQELSEYALKTARIERVE
jgi:L-alanine-DL-glutamate epimerase-like enolase superfamily enzyme